MKINVILALLMIIGAGAGARAQEKKADSFQITGQFQNAANLKVYIKEGDKPGQFKDSTTADASGKFTFKGKVIEPISVYLYFGGIQGSRKFFLENAVMTVNGDAKKDLYQAKISGSRENRLFDEYKEKNSAINERMASLIKPYLEALESKAKPEKRDTIEYMSLAKKASFRWRDSVVSQQTEFISAHPHSAVSLEVMTYVLSVVPPTKLDSLMRLMERTPVGQYAMALKLRGMIDKLLKLSLGALAPDFIQPDTAGKDVQLSSMRGKYVLVDFWASWCAPCRMENPNVLKAYHKFKDRNFTVLAVSIDTDRKAWVKAIKEDKMPWTQVSDLKAGNEAGKLYAVSAVPTNYLLDPEGKIIAVNLRGDALEQALDQNLSKGSR